MVDGGSTRLAPSTPVARSWLRSRESGLSPDDEPHYDELLPASRHRHERQSDRQLWKYTREEIEHLWGAFGGNDWIIMCINPQGDVVHARHSPYLQESVLKPVASGRTLREEYVGTTAPSCVIHDQRSIVVNGSQHYLKAFSRVFCLAVPLFDAHGQTAGVLDITGVGERDAVLLHEHFRMAALSVQQRFFFDLRYCHLLSVQYDPRLLDSPLAGIIAVEEDGHIRAVSQQARRLLSLPVMGPLPRMDLRSLFPGARAPQHRRFLQPSSRAQRILVADDVHVWVQHMRLPVTTRGPVSRSLKVSAAEKEDRAPTLPVNASLKENTLSAIQYALHENNGNVAATARQLGISRTTLYSKLRQT